MDGLKRQERVKAEALIEEPLEESEILIEEEPIVEPVKKEKRSFLEAFSERVKDFLDNAE